MTLDFIVSVVQFISSHMIMLLVEYVLKVIIVYKDKNILVKMVLIYRSKGKLNALYVHQDTIVIIKMVQ